jgi:hypothetical protein
MEVLQPQYLSVSYYQPIIEAIEAHFGKYQYAPRVVLTPGLYKSYGALGETHFIRRGDGQPVLTQIDADIWHNRSYLGLETLVHELLEWRFIERGEQYPHFLSEQNTPIILSEVLETSQQTLVDAFLQRHALIRRIILGT